jgi:hypothetical protein
MAMFTNIAAGAAFVGGALFGGGKKQSQSRSFDIDSFAAELGKYGTAKPYLFSVIISPPPGADLGIPTDAMMLRIESVSMPRRSLMTIDQRHYGPTRKIPYMIDDYATINVEVIMSEDMREREFFMRWQDLFVSGGLSWNNSARITGQNNNYDSSYYDECFGRVNINQYAESPAFQGVQQSKGGLLDTIIGTAQAVGINTSAITNPFGINLGINSQSSRSVKPCYEITLNEVYPISIQEVQMSWSNEGMAKLNVELQYRTIQEKNNIQQATTAGRGLADLVRSGINTLNAFRPALGVISKQGLGGAIGGGLQSTSSSALGGTKGLFTF